MLERRLATLAILLDPSRSDDLRGRAAFAKLGGLRGLTAYFEERPGFAGA